MSNGLTVQVGTINGGATAIVADISGGVQGDPETAVAVTLSTDYQMLDPPGYPFRPSFTGAAIPQYPHTVPSGTTITVLQPEAAALVAASAASYA